MEEEEIEMQEKGKEKNPGWFGERAKHSLCARGYRLNKRKDKNLDRRFEEIRDLSAAGNLDWQSFEKVFGDDAEQKLSELIEQGKLEFDSYPDNNERLRYGQVKVEVEQDGELKSYILDRDSELRLVSY